MCRLVCDYALEGLDPDYRTGMQNPGSTITGSGEMFDPTKKTPTAVPAP